VQVLHEGVAQQIHVVRAAHNGRDLRESGLAGGAQPSLAHDELVALTVRVRPHHNGLQDADLLDGADEFGERVGVEVLTRLARIRHHLSRIDVREARSGNGAKSVILRRACLFVWVARVLVGCVGHVLLRDLRDRRRIREEHVAGASPGARRGLVLVGGFGGNEGAKPSTQASLGSAHCVPPADAPRSASSLATARYATAPGEWGSCVITVFPKLGASETRTERGTVWGNVSSGKWLRTS